jgi:hypothetical protein
MRNASSEPKPGASGGITSRRNAGTSSSYRIRRASIAGRSNGATAGIAASTLASSSGGASLRSEPMGDDEVSTLSEADYAALRASLPAPRDRRKAPREKRPTIEVRRSCAPITSPVARTGSPGCRASSNGPTQCAAR